jgi:hypothetical protein
MKGQKQAQKQVDFKKYLIYYITNVKSHGFVTS